MASRKPITKISKKPVKAKKTPLKVRKLREKTALKALKVKRDKTVKVKKKSAVIFSAQPNLIEKSLLSAKILLQNAQTSAQKSFHNETQQLKKFIGLYQKYIPSKNASTVLKKKKLQQKKHVKRTQKPNNSNKKLTTATAAVTKPFRAVFGFIRNEFFAPFHYVFRYHFVIMILSLVISGGILFSAYEVYDIVFKDLPSVSELTTRKQNLTTKILDRNGKLLYSIYKDENRTLIPLSQVPPDLIHATISIEDRNFYTHRGISIRGIFRAFISNAQGGGLQGGSTITQQLVKNTLLSPERTFKRKVREIVLAFLVEGTYSKNEILEMYFNEVGYGGSTYGAEEAAERYFGKSVHQLDLAESAFLAGLPAAPSDYSPFGATPERAYERQHEVLRRMVEDKYISQAQADAAKNEKLTFRQDMTDIKAPHFVMYVKSLLEKQYGEDVVNRGGLEVRTTLDLDTQNQAQSIVTNEVNNLAPLNISNGAALVTNPQTGEILAMIGSKNYFDFAKDGQVNVTMRPRQPGSSIKPITYSVAFEKGKTPSSTVLDAPVVFNTAGSPPYAPKNYDGKFHGLVTLRTALASSFNIPAVKTLAEVGIDNMIDKAQQMGISTWTDRKRFGLSLTLGSGEVLMTDMAKVYGTFPNHGMTVDLNPLLEVKNYKGEVLYQNTCATDHTGCPATRTLDPLVSYEITDVLSDNNARTPAFGPRSVLYIPGQQVAVKTGTTNNLKDNWSIGYTDDRLVAVWVGNNDGQPMSYVASGITGASPIWNKIMRTQLDDAHPHVFALPDNLVKLDVCTAGSAPTLPCQGCPHVSTEIFVKGTEPTQACSSDQFVNKIDTLMVDPNTRDKILQGISISN